MDERELRSSLTVKEYKKEAEVEAAISKKSYYDASFGTFTKKSYYYAPAKKAKFNAMAVKSAPEEKTASQFKKGFPPARRM